VKKIILTGLAFSLMFGFAACKKKSADTAQTPESIATYHNSQNSLDWAGTYRGVIPSSDTFGIKVSITLRYDSTYTLIYEYLGKKLTIVGNGKFEWNETGSAIKLLGLDGKDMPIHYFVGEGFIQQLDLQGNRITGKLADRYILKKDI